MIIALTIILIALLIIISKSTDIYSDYELKIHSLAYSFWVNRLHKEGFPRNANGSYKNDIELYQYWNDEVPQKEKDSLIEFYKQQVK